MQRGFQGKNRIGTVSLGQSLMILDKAELHDFEMFLLLSRGEIYEPEVTTFVTQNLKNGDVFLDIGANNGYYTILASGIVGKTGKVISVEPNKSVFSRLLNNIQVNHLENVLAFNFALSDFNGTAQLYLSNGTEDGQGSLLSSIEKHSVQEVEVKNFNEVFSEEKIDMIKMDVEGSEISILKSLENYISTHKNIKIIMEWNGEYRNSNDYRYLSKNYDIYLLLWEARKLEKIRIEDYNDMLDFSNLLLLPK